jgi:hypothetical protein
MLHEYNAVLRIVDAVKTGWIAGYFRELISKYHSQFMSAVSERITEEILKVMNLKFCYSTVSGFFIRHIAAVKLPFGRSTWNQPSAVHYRLPEHSWVNTPAIQYFHSLVANAEFEEQNRGAGVSLVAGGVSRYQASMPQISNVVSDERIVSSLGPANMMLHQQRSATALMSIEVPNMIPANRIVAVILPDGRLIDILIPLESLPGSQVIVSVPVAL